LVGDAPKKSIEDQVSTQTTIIGKQPRSVAAQEKVWELKVIGKAYLNNIETRDQRTKGESKTCAISLIKFMNPEKRQVNPETGRSHPRRGGDIGFREISTTFSRL